MTVTPPDGQDLPANATLDVSYFQLADESDELAKEVGRFVTLPAGDGRAESTQAFGIPLGQVNIVVETSTGS